MDELTDAQQAKVDFTTIKDQCITGSFEVRVDGELLHSKKERGDGFLHQNPETMQAVKEAIFGKIGK